MGTVPVAVAGAAKKGVLSTVKDILCKSRAFNLALIGEPGSGKTATSSTLTPGKGTCVIATLPVSQMITHYPETRIYQPSSFKDAIDVLKNPASVFGDGIETLVLDDSTTLIARGLDEKGILTANEPRRVYKDVQTLVEPALLAAVSAPFNFILIGQARKMGNDITGLQEITLDVPPSMENTAVAYVDYIFFVNKAQKMNEAPTLQMVKSPTLQVLTKLKFTRDQFGKIPLKEQEPADLALLWKKLSGGV